MIFFPLFGIVQIDFVRIIYYKRNRGILMRVFGMEIYNFALWFFIFSFFGYILECIVVSIENHKLIYNRGFCHLPFCIIYGFGGVGAFLILTPVANSLPLLFIASSMAATIFELLTAHIMIRLFGSIWWDYSKKKYNYKGIVCLESSIGWGFLGIFFFGFLNGFMQTIVLRIPDTPSKYIAAILVLVYGMDFLYCFIQRLRHPDKIKEVEGRMKVV